METESRSAFIDGKQWAWDATSIHLAETCLRKYFYRNVEGWSRPNTSVHLLFGGWYAKALEHYYKYRGEGRTSADALREVVRETLIATWEYDPCEDCNGTGFFKFFETTGAGLQAVETLCGTCNGSTRKAETGRPWASDHNTKTRETLLRSIIWYVDQFENEEIHVVQLAEEEIECPHCANGMVTDDASEEFYVKCTQCSGTGRLRRSKPAVELSFTFEIEDTVFCGHIDRLVQYNGDYYVMDQKTTGTTLTARYFDQYNPHTQMSLYTLAGQIIYDMPVKGVIIDAAQIAVGFTRFERGFTFRTKSQLDEFINNALYWIDKVEEAHRINYWPMNTASCGDYGGCEFRGICARSPEHRGQFLKGDFTRGQIWDPLRTR